MQEEHRQIQANRKDGEYLTWSELNKMPFTAKVSSTMIIIIFNTYIYSVNSLQVLNSFVLHSNSGN